MQRGVLGVLICAVVLAGSAGCGQRGRVAYTPPPTVVHPTVQAPANRDSAAVTAALLRVDPCALIDPAKAKAPAFPVTERPVRLGPHWCSVSGDGLAEVRLTLGADVDRSDRFDSLPLIVGGVKAYLDVTSCKLWIPVSFTQAIEFEVAASTSAVACRQAVTAFAFAGVAVLAGRGDSAPGSPLAGWDACTVLTSARPEDGSGRPPRPDGLDECVQDEGRYRVSFNHGDPPEVNDEPIGGRPVAEYEGGGCSIAWQHGRSGLPDPGRSAQIVRLHASDCPSARQFAAAVMKVLAQTPPARGEPQRPLTYGPDEPDVAAAGGCVDLRSGPCEPYHPVDPPKGADEVRRRVAADPNVNCVIAVDAVRKRLGAAFRPVTTELTDDRRGGHPACAFVEPGHALIVELWVTGQTEWPVAGKQLSLAGRAAVLSSSRPTSGGRVERITVTAAPDVLLNLRFTMGPARAAADRDVVDVRRGALAQPLATDVLTAYF